MIYKSISVICRQFIKLLLFKHKLLCLRHKAAYISIVADKTTGIENCKKRKSHSRGMLRLRMTCIKGPIHWAVRCAHREFYFFPASPKVHRENSMGAIIVYMGVSNQCSFIGYTLMQLNGSQYLLEV